MTEKQWGTLRDALSILSWQKREGADKWSPRLQPLWADLHLRMCRVLDLAEAEVRANHSEPLRSRKHVPCGTMLSLAELWEHLRNCEYSRTEERKAESE